jgi:hypothetical protein
LTSTWITIVVTLMKLAHSLTTYLQSRRLMQAGEDRVIATTALAIFNETQSGKELREHIEKLDDTEATALWDRMLK